MNMMELDFGFLLGANSPRHDLGRLVWPVSATVLAIAFLAWGVFRLRAWLREETNPEAQWHEMLTKYRELHDRGELTDAEFTSIKERLLGKKRPLPSAVPSAQPTEN